MANQGAKKRKEENDKHVKFLALVVVLSNGFYILFRMVFFGSSTSYKHFLGMIFTSGVYYVTYEWLKDLAKASVNDDGELVDGGADMSGGGMCGVVINLEEFYPAHEISNERSHSILFAKYWSYWTKYLHDILYITSFVQVTSVISEKFWYTYLVIPMFAFYKLWQLILYPYFFQSQKDEPEDEVSRKKREKAERKANRPKFGKVRR